VSAARAVRRQDEPYVDPDRELCANGVAAVIGSFLHTLPPSGGFSQSSVNVRSGARSQVSGLVTAALAVVVACFLAPVLGYLPEATIGAMVLVSVIGLVDVRALARLYRFNMMEFSLALLTTALALSVGLLPAVAAGVLLTLYFVLREANSAHVVQLVRRPDGSWTERAVTAAAVPADPLVLRFQIGLYTANLRSNSQAVRQRALGADPRPRLVVLDLSQLPWVTSTILDGLRDLEAELSGNGVSVTYTALRDSVRPTAQRWPWWHQVESEGRYAESADAAIARGPGHDGA